MVSPDVEYNAMTSSNQSGTATAKMNVGSSNQNPSMSSATGYTGKATSPTKLISSKPTKVSVPSSKS